ncbi:MAG: hypothetical protein UE116_02400 [Clostridia bacterium]|jgi:hypothetical protein|nr:hypothetical protein [Clostridia bacterium]
MTDKEREFIREENIDKAKKKTIAPMVFIGISLLTYVMPLMWGEFDFGILFEVASLVFLILARNYMSQYDETRAKRYIICSIVSIGWILIYDIILLCVSIQDAIDVAFLGYDYLLGEFFLILYLIILFAINKDLSKADNPEKYKESTDWFYERYESDEKNDIK